MTEYENGDFSVDLDTRKVRGMLLPYGHLSRINATKNMPLMFQKGTMKVPADLRPLNVNRHHNHYDPVANFDSVEETEQGLFAVFSVSTNPSGDEFLEQYKDGSIRKLSAEFTRIVRDPTNYTNAVSAELTGAAFVSEGAYEEAALFALSPEEAEQIPLFTDEEIVKLRALLAETPEDSDESEDPETPPTQQATEPLEEEQESTVAEALAPENMNASKEVGASEVFDLITAARSGVRGTESADMALADIKISGTGAVPAAGVLQPTWLGEVWAGAEPTRRYAPLVKNGTIVALEEKGFKLSAGTELVKTWAGNKAELPTGTATTSIITGDAIQKFAFAADIAQEFFLIPAGRPVIEAFIREVFRSYARVSDLAILQKIYAAGVAGGKTNAATYPTGYPAALGKLIQGVDKIDDTDVTPTFAIVAPDVYTQLRYTPKDQLPEFINFGFGRQEGTADGVTVIRDKNGVLSAGDVLVGSSEAAHVNELPGSPVEFDALDIAHGGLDKSVIGMIQWMTEYPEGFCVIGNAS